MQVGLPAQTLKVLSEANGSSEKCVYGYKWYYTDFGHVRSFRLAASPFGLAASLARRPPAETVAKVSVAGLKPTESKNTYTPQKEKSIPST